MSDLIRDPAGRVTDRIRAVGEDHVCTSIVVAAKLRYGATKRGSRALSTRVEAVLGAMEVLPLDAPADITYGDIRAKLERSGTPIGGNDLLIAAHGLSLGYTVVTDNVSEFSRIEGLAFENWLRDAG